MTCTNPECEMFEKKTLYGTLVRGGEETVYCLYCHENIDESMQIAQEMPKGPYIKRKSWLNQWKHVNTGRTTDDVKLKPKFDT